MVVLVVIRAQHLKLLEFLSEPLVLGLLIDSLPVNLIQVYLEPIFHVVLLRASAVEVAVRVGATQLVKLELLLLGFVVVSSLNAVFLVHNLVFVG